MQQQKGAARAACTRPSRTNMRWGARTPPTAGAYAHRHHTGTPPADPSAPLRPTSAVSGASPRSCPARRSGAGRRAPRWPRPAPRSRRPPPPPAAQSACPAGRTPSSLPGSWAAPAAPAGLGWGAHGARVCRGVGGGAAHGVGSACEWCRPPHTLNADSRPWPCKQPRSGCCAAHVRCADPQLLPGAASSPTSANASTPSLARPSTPLMVTVRRWWAAATSNAPAPGTTARVRGAVSTC
jgi:hypothetical protein